MTADDGLAEKRARSEARRLESLAEKRRLEKQRRDAVAEALRKVDNTAAASRRIVFDSEDEDEKPSSSKKERKTMKLTLFEDDEGEEDTLLIKNRHAGEKGAKLMALESRFNNDPRFRLNENFVEDEDEEKEKEEPEKKALKEEKKAELEILARVLGKFSVKTETKKVSKSQARPFTRFDPDNPDHVRWMQEHTKTIATKEVKREEEAEREEEDEAPVAPGHFFSMSESFAKELKKKLVKEKEEDESGGFSFLEMMGRKKVEEAKQMEDSKEPMQPPLKRRKEEEKIKPARVPLAATALPFFITGDEPQVRSVVANFRRTQTLEKTTAAWKKSLPSIVKIYKHQRRFALKQQRDAEKYSKRGGGFVNDKDQKGCPRKKEGEED